MRTWRYQLAQHTMHVYIQKSHRNFLYSFSMGNARKAAACASRPLSLSPPFDESSAAATFTCTSFPGKRDQLRIIFSSQVSQSFSPPNREGREVESAVCRTTQIPDLLSPPLLLPTLSFSWSRSPVAQAEAKVRRTTGQSEIFRARVKLEPRALLVSG